MVTKIDRAAASQAKQKKILIVGSVLLVALLGIQVPKILGGGKSTAKTPAAVAASTTSGTASTGGPVPPASTPGGTTLATGPAATVGGVRVATSRTPGAGVAQLASFSLFETKDPFVQGITEADRDGTPETAGASAAAKSTLGGNAGGSAVGGDSKPAAPGDSKPAAPKLTNATIAINGEPEPVEVKGTFPSGHPLFLLAGLKSKAAKIGIAGGTLTNGETVTLAFGKKLTLVDTATGARYTLELLYSGTAPEQTAEFSPSETEGTAPAASAK